MLSKSIIEEPPWMIEKELVPKRYAALEIERSSLLSNLDKINLGDTMNEQFASRKVLLLRYPERHSINSR